MPDGIPQFVVPSLVKVEPEKLQDSIPKFKPWISSTAWGHWENFLESHLPKLGDIPADCNNIFCLYFRLHRVGGCKFQHVQLLKKTIMQMTVKCLRRCLMKKEFQSR